MTQDEIKKGLEYAAKVTGNGVFAGAYKIITEQEKEIEQLKAKNKVLGDGVVKAFTNGFNTGREQVEKDIRRAKIDALKELKTRYDYANNNMGYPWDITKQIDELIKEVEND